MPGLWYNAHAPEYEQKASRSIIHPFNVRGYSGLTINPYQGCQHRCAYCYATYEWSPEFYDRIYAKSNAPEILERELASWKGTKVDPVMVSSATDAYQPAELRYGLTRKCVQVLQKYKVPYYVFTKSAIIERDLELHAKYRDNCFIVWSVTTCNEQIRRIVEPGTPPAARIFEAIEKFTLAGVPCGVNVDPIMPLVTDSEREIGAVVEACRRAGVKHIFGAMLRLRTDIWDRMKAALALLGVEDGIERYKKLYGFEEPLAASYVACDKDYSKQITGMLEEMVRAGGMKSDFPDHLGTREIDRSCTGQKTILSYVAT
ncbi:radical SAM protein [Nitrososphaera sp.]|uniref:SPL family radical SAM protein n=1 Tax=Nitrososphaera sp. TaxID=1971748 RepID=UPI00317C1B89